MYDWPGCLARAEQVGRLAGSIGALLLSFDKLFLRCLIDSRANEKNARFLGNITLTASRSRIHPPGLSLVFVLGY